MRTTKGKSADIQRLRSALVREGVTTYPLAMQALAEFRREVFEILERLAKRRATAISQIVGSKELERDWDEVDDFLDGPDTCLSVFTKGACSFRIDVFWQDVDRPPASVRIAAGIWCEKRATFEKVDKALQDKFGNRVTTNVEDYECYLEKAIPPEQIDKLEAELGEICDAWIRMLRSVNVRKLIHSKQ
jgi:hypothetical protein